MSNRATYEARDMVRLYISSGRLQAGELAVIRAMGPRLRDARMLDVGVGAGRTALHFASRVESYTAVDFSAPMIAACKGRCPTLAHAFSVADARKLPFADGSFDFVLFSFNGIDYVDHDGRLRALDEMRRVLVRGGTFAFSTHNLENAGEWYRAFDRDRPLASLARLPLYAALRALNPPRDALAGAPYAILNDGAYRFRLRTYYVRPAEQLSQLARAGFDDVRVFAKADGTELRGEHALARAKDPWLYYMCTAAPRAIDATHAATKASRTAASRETVDPMPA